MLITFYTSYVFVHFFLLDVFLVDNTLAIIAKVMIGHLFLNYVTLGITKKSTFGDLLLKIEYQSIRANFGQVTLILLRSTITAVFLYLLVIGNYLAGFSNSSLTTSLGLVLILNWYKITIDDKKLSITDWLSGTVAVKRQRK